MQSLLGLINFACKVVAPGRAFCPRLINSTISITKHFYRIRITKTSMKADLRIWQEFLKSYNGISVISLQPWVHNTIELFSDSEGGQNGGFGIYFKRKWTHGSWPTSWAKQSIIRDMTLELFPMVVSLIVWQSQFTNSKLLFNIDSLSVVQVIKQSTSKSKRVMNLGLVS